MCEVWYAEPWSTNIKLSTSCSNLFSYYEAKGNFINNMKLNWAISKRSESFQMGHSTPNGAKFLKFGHDPSQNLIKVYQVVTIYKI